MSMTEVPKYLAESKGVIAHNIGKQQKEVEMLILAVPTSEERNNLTEANIHLMLAIAALKR